MIGLKLWSSNTKNYLKVAKELFKEGVYDYIELYYVPKTLNTVEIWKDTKIPFTVHAPHFSHGINLANKKYEKYNREIFTEVKEFAKKLEARYTIIHSGSGGEINESIRQLKELNLENILIENKPYFSLLGKDIICCGTTFEELSYIKENITCEICLDIGHAFCTYNALKDQLKYDSPYEYIELLNTLSPKCYHISDNFIDSTVDRHFHFGDGQYNFEKIFNIIHKDKDISIETSKDFQDNLNDFKNDVNFLKKYL